MEESFGFLLSHVSRLLRQRFDERARAAGATRAQWKALLGISRHEGGLNQGSLADLLEVEPITLCRLVDRMEEAGLVQRRRDPKDRRAWQLFLTEKAKPIIIELRTVADEITAQALAGISATEAARLGTALNRIRENLASTSVLKEAANG